MKAPRSTKPTASAGEKPAASSKSTRHSRGAAIAALTLALAAAVYLNWSLARSAPVTAGQTEGAVTDALPVDAPLQDAAILAPGEEDITAVYDPLTADNSSDTSDGQSANKNYGEAQLVSVSKDTGTEFFENARLTRSRTRDAALEEIERALKNSTLSKEEKEALRGQLATQLTNLTLESDLETLIKAKGFADCVVMLTETGANVTVMTENDALTAAEVTRIRDAVLNRCTSLSAQDITVVEVK